MCRVFQGMGENKLVISDDELFSGEMSKDHRETADPGSPGLSIPDVPGAVWGSSHLLPCWILTPAFAP